MITLDEYKQYLLNNYKYKADGKLARIIEREFFLSKFYPDEYLNKIIVDSYDFIKDLFHYESLKKGYVHIELEKNSSTGIYLNKTGGGYSDELFVDEQERIISKYILKKVFGSQFHIEIDCDETLFETEIEELIGVNYHYYLYMQGFPNNLDEIKENLFGKSKINHV